ncbi:hypothetical protein GA0061100_1153 [Rhizobium hainanense]|uniref:Uncharacterized protein n=1 Tax=Rhizobium hainanense TaxID=52131 RepID=A0A1C3WBZ9_9HYPH|nr:hypothetical protein GA0061100_1153 [Rhizobium hainanense]
MKPSGRPYGQAPASALRLRLEEGWQMSVGLYEYISLGVAVAGLVVAILQPRSR